MIGKVFNSSVNRNMPIFIIMAITVIIIAIILYTKILPEQVSIILFNKNTVLGNSSENTSPQLAVSGNNGYVAWIEPSAGNDIIKFSKGENNTTFAKPIHISDKGGNSSNPQIATSGNKVYIAWVNNTKQGGNDIYFSKGENGTTFTKPERISDKGGNSSNPQIAASGNNVYIAWVNNTKQGGNDIYFSKGENGTTFTKPDRISSKKGNSSNPQIAVFGDNVYVTWLENDIGKNISTNFRLFFRGSTTQGTDFNDDKIIDKKTGQIPPFPRVTASGNNVYVTWVDSSNQGVSQILFSKSSDKGTNFTKPERISDRKENSIYPQFANAGNNTYVVWTEHSPGNDNVIFAKGNSTTFTKPKRLSDENGSSSFPKIAASENIIATVWMDHNKILFSESTNNGEKFTRAIALSNNSAVAYSPQIAVSGNDAYVVWIENKSGKNEIVFKQVLTNLFPH
jgi:hypothetical protein